MARAKGRRFWERLVSEVEAGASQVEVARRHGVSQGGLGLWVRRLRQERERRSEPQLLPVRLTTPTPVRRCGLVVDELRLEFDEGTDPAYLAAIARALRTC